MRRVVGAEMGVKAAGGVRDLADLKAMVAAGATRIGASAGVKIVQQARGAWPGLHGACLHVRLLNVHFQLQVAGFFSNLPGPSRSAIPFTSRGLSHRLGSPERVRITQQLVARQEDAMRSTARRLAVVALVGLLFLTWRAQTDQDLVVAQTGKPIMATRIYTGPDGQSHAEEVPDEAERQRD